MAYTFGITICRYCEQVTAVMTSGEVPDSFTINFTECHFCHTAFSFFKKKRIPYWCTPPPLSSEHEVSVGVQYRVHKKGLVKP